MSRAVNPSPVTLRWQSRSCAMLSYTFEKKTSQKTWECLRHISFHQAALEAVLHQTWTTHCLLNGTFLLQVVVSISTEHSRVGWRHLRRCYRAQTHRGSSSQERCSVLCSALTRLLQKIRVIHDRKSLQRTNKFECKYSNLKPHFDLKQPSSLVGTL